MTHINNETIEKIIQDRKMRVEIAKESHYWFFHMYFPHYITYPTAKFQKDFFALSEDEYKNPLAIMAFRGSAKSTIFTLSYPIWSILGRQQKKFVVLLGETQRQAKQHLINIKRELEGNELLKNDLGPFKEQEDEWGSYSLVLPWYNARITAASMEQTIRGLRHNQYRPDLIICDDIEDLSLVKTKENRDKIYSWITSEVIPAGDINTRLVFVGNLLHEDSFLMRLKENIIKNDIDGHFIEIPLIKDDNIMWPEKFKSMEDIKKLENKVSDKVSWEREYMLKIISTSERVVHPEWIHYYDYDKDLPRDKNLLTVYVGVDLAISEKSSANRTAIVTMKIYEDGDKKKAYIMPHPFNDTIGFPEQVEQIKLLVSSMNNPHIFVEKVAYQESIIQHCEKGGIQIEGITPHGDKRERLALTTAAIKEGLILFPQKGAEELIGQLTGFGVEKFDDLADGFSLAANQFIAYCNVAIPGITFISVDMPRRGGLSSDDDWDDDDDFGRGWKTIAASSNCNIY